MLPLLLLPLLLSLSGCILLIAGGAATGGYALSTDSAEGIIDSPYDEVWEAAVTVFEDDGIIELQDEKHGRLEAEVDSIDMKVQIDAIGKESTKLKVTARKYMMPKAKQAEKEFVRISELLKK